MKVKEYLSKCEKGFELTCWDSVIDEEFYLYADPYHDSDFPNVSKFMEQLHERLEITEFHKDGVVVDLYELLDDPIIIDFARKNIFSHQASRCDEDIVELLFDSVVSNINNGYENFSGMMLEAFKRVDDMRSNEKGSLSNYIEKTEQSANIQNYKTIQQIMQEMIDNSEKEIQTYSLEELDYEPEPLSFERGYRQALKDLQIFLQHEKPDIERE